MSGRDRLWQAHFFFSESLAERRDAKMGANERGRVVQKGPFSWSVTSGKIVKGQKTREIEVDTTGADQQLRATVEVLGFDPACAIQEFCTVEIKK